MALWFGLAPVGHAQVQLMNAPMEVQSDAAMSLRVFAVNWELDGPLALRHIRLHVYNASPQALEATLLVPLGPKEQFHGVALETQGRWVDAAQLNRMGSDVTLEAEPPAGVSAAPSDKEEGKRLRVRMSSIPAQGFRSVQITVASSAQEASCGWMHPLVLPRGAYHGFALSVQARSEQAPSSHTTWRATGNHSEAGARTWQMWARTSTQLPRMVCLTPAMPAPQVPQGLPSGAGPGQVPAQP
jgi:hypothetical protein